MSTIPVSNIGLLPIFIEYPDQLYFDLFCRSCQGLSHDCVNRYFRGEHLRTHQVSAGVERFDARGKQQ